MFAVLLHYIDVTMQLRNSRDTYTTVIPITVAQPLYSLWHYSDATIMPTLIITVVKL